MVHSQSLGISFGRPEYPGLEAPPKNPVIGLAARVQAYITDSRTRTQPYDQARAIKRATQELVHVAIQDALVVIHTDIEVMSNSMSKEDAYKLMRNVRARIDEYLRSGGKQVIIARLKSEGGQDDILLDGLIHRKEVTILNGIKTKFSEEERQLRARMTPEEKEKSTMNYTQKLAMLWIIKKHNIRSAEIIGGWEDSCLIFFKTKLENEGGIRVTKNQKLVFRAGRD